MKIESPMVRFLLVLLMIAVIAGCAGNRTRESTGEYVDDSIITAKVKAAILGDPALKVLQISVETFKGVVQLSGFVNSPQVVSRATEVASRVSGVVSVKNNLIVK
ncbi:MAG TPA: BON domain-containing protein [bacterium]|nr:BON domain-containing protein [bacterium]